jgi:hypothetical protein
MMNTLFRVSESLRTRSMNPRTQSMRALRPQ